MSPPPRLTEKYGQGPHVARPPEEKVFSGQLMHAVEPEGAKVPGPQAGQAVRELAS